VSAICRALEVGYHADNQGSEAFRCIPARGTAANHLSSNHRLHVKPNH